MNYSELRRDLVFGLATLLFGAFYFASCFATISVRASNIGVSGRTFPLIVAVILLVLGASLSLSTLRKIRQIPKASRRYYSLFEANQLFGMSVYFGALCIYILGIEYVGYIVSSVLVVLFLLKFSLAKNKIAIAVMTVLLPGGLYWVFTKAMEVQLPITPLP